MKKPILTGSICFTDLMAEAKNGNAAFSRAANGKVYCNFIAWEKEQDKFGNNLSLQLNRPKDSDLKQPYFGNGKLLLNSVAQEKPKEEIFKEKHGAVPLSDDLPF